MKKETYPIPEGCKSITVESDIETNSLKICFDPFAPGEFLCKETRHIEEHPSLGDLSIFWDDGDESSAIISLLKDWERSDDGIMYMAENGIWCRNAIRFRNEEQYIKILGKWQTEN